MKKIFIIGLLVLLLSGCSQGQMESTPAGALSTPLQISGTLTATPILPSQLEGYKSMKKVCLQSVNGVKKLQAPLDLPEFTDMNDMELQLAVDSFDVNQYFQVLEHLKVESGYYLSHMYYDDYLGAKPVLYAVPIADGPFLRYSKYVDYLGNNIDYWDRTFVPQEFGYVYLNHIEIDDSAEGFFQFIVLFNLGDQFHLFWHALYNDTIILCDRSGIRKVNRELKDWGLKLPKNAAAQVKDLDVTPYAIFTEDSVVIRVVQFSKWVGYFETIYTIDREAPYQNMDVEGNILIPYDSEIDF